MHLDPIPKVLVVVGSCLIIVAILWQFGIFQIFRLGRLPGDVVIENQNTKFYFPIVTCLVISAALSFLNWIIRKL